MTNAGDLRHPPLVMVTGGARSGKSRWAEDLAAGLAERHALPVHYLATSGVMDDEMAGRVRQHRERRPANWSTVEEPLDLAGPARNLAPGVLLIDCLILWTSNWMQAQDVSKSSEPIIAGETQNWLRALRSANRPAVVVTGEVGLGIVPESRTARIFRDLLGRVNQEVAREATEVYLVVSGLPVRIKP